MSLPDVSRLHRMPGTALRDRLRELGIGTATLRRLTERGDSLRAPLTPNREALYSDVEDAVAVRLLFCRVPVPGGEAEAALGPELTVSLLDCGVLDVGESGVTAGFHLRPVLHLYLLSDYLNEADSDAVMGAGETTAVLYSAARPEGRVGSVLDLGCGAGTLALLLAEQAERVLGTDINERAVRLARANAALNGVVNAEFRAGSLYDPLATEHFDLIVSQPPYYPAGELSAGHIVYLHGGAAGDEIARGVLEGVPRHLTADGTALVFSSWPASTGPGPLNGLRVLVLRTGRQESYGGTQALCVVRGGGEWYAIFDVPADCWSAVSARRIKELFAAHNLANAPDAVVRHARLRLIDGVTATPDSDDVIVAGTAETLLGVRSVPAARWEVLQHPEQATAEDRRRALREGWLETH